MKIPIMWRKFFLDIANNGEFNNNYCSKPYNKYHRYYREWYLYNLKKSNTVMN